MSDASTAKEIRADGLGWMRTVAETRACLAAEKASDMGLDHMNNFGEPFRADVSGLRV